MNIKIPDHIGALKSYQPGKTIIQLKEDFGWEKVAVLWNNENTLGFSKKSQETVLKAYEEINYYPDPLSTKLRERLASKLGRTKDQIMVGNGSESILMHAIRALCSGDDEFLTSEGAFVIIYNWTKINNIRCVSMPLDHQYAFDLKNIRNRINRNTKIIYLANVNNPTGTMISKEEFDAFMQHVPDDVLVIMDEAYIEFSKAIDRYFPDSIAMNHPNVLTIRTFSKAYGIAGVRLGFGVGQEKIIEAMMKTKLTFEPTSLAQAAGIGALEDTDFLEKTIANNLKGLNYFEAAFSRLGIQFVKSYGNFIMTVWKDKNEVGRVFNELMKKGVLVRPLMPPLDHCIRISIGRPEENEHCVASLTEIL